MVRNLEEWGNGFLQEEQQVLSAFTACYKSGGFLNLSVPFFIIQFKGKILWSPCIVPVGPGVKENQPKYVGDHIVWFAVSNKVLCLWPKNGVSSASVK